LKNCIVLAAFPDIVPFFYGTHFATSLNVLASPETLWILFLSDLMFTFKTISLELFKHFFTLRVMNKITAAITAVSGWVPPDILSNKDLEKMVDTNDEWIQSRTGIKERRILKGEGLATSDMGAEAVKLLCKKREYRPRN
jgi:hypothetical protein